MYLTTTKTYNDISLSEIKEALRISIDDPTYDAEILTLIQAAISVIETFLGENVAYSLSTMEDYCVNGQYYRVQEPNITVTGVTVFDQVGNSTIITGTTFYRYFNSTILKFPTSINAHRLVINYTSGYPNEIPAVLKRAMIIKIRELFDNGDQYVSNNMTNTHAFERLLTPLINLNA